MLPNSWASDGVTDPSAAACWAVAARSAETSATTAAPALAGAVAGAEEDAGEGDAEAGTAGCFGSTSRLCNSARWARWSPRSGPRPDLSCGCAAVTAWYLAIMAALAAITERRTVTSDGTRPASDTASDTAQPAVPIDDAANADTASTARRVGLTGTRKACHARGAFRAGWAG
jgi:hypothetical protein